MYARVLDGGSAVKYTLNQLYKDYPNTSFPVPTGHNVLAAYNVYPMTRTEVPVVDYTKNVVEGSPALIGNEWTQTWVIVDASVEEAADRLTTKWIEIRNIRNELLALCDWTQLADAPVDDLAWAVYRQSLRDITLQTDPFNIVWPISP